MHKSNTDCGKGKGKIDDVPAYDQTPNTEVGLTTTTGDTHVHPIQLNVTDAVVYDQTPAATVGLTMVADEPVDPQFVDVQDVKSKLQPDNAPQSVAAEVDDSDLHQQRPIRRKNLASVLCSPYFQRKKTFANYLIQNQHPNGRHISTAKIHRLAMPWRTEFNKVDCGVFLMRHMETYKGCLLNWECGLCGENEANNLQKLQLNDLRKKYVTKIILHDLNKRFYWVTKDLMRYPSLPVELRREADINAHGNIASRLLGHAD
ncbi:hypothetical protein R6Q57_012285 [Mikania cordata]